MIAPVYYFFIAIPFVKPNEFNPQKNMVSESQFTFKDYLRKFKPSEVWSDIEQANKQKGLNKTLKDEFATVFSRIDQTEELLNLTVKKGDPKMVVNKDGRRWKPPGDVIRDHPFDPFSIKRRLLELMKLAIYEVRSSMVIMQILREKYNTATLYKMGFLFGKTDVTCNTFSDFAFKAFKACTMSRQNAIKSYPIVEKLEAHERLLDLWFDIDLLIDLINANDLNCKEMLKTAKQNRKEAWKYID